MSFKHLKNRSFLEAFHVDFHSPRSLGYSNSFYNVRIFKVNTLTIKGRITPN